MKAFRDFRLKLAAIPSRAHGLKMTPSGLLVLVVLVVVAVGLLLTSSPMTAQTKAKTSRAGEFPSGNAENGKRLFLRDGCYECHGRGAQGGGYTGPRLAPDPMPLEFILSYVRQPTGEMPPFTGKVISDNELADIYAFLKSVPPPPDVKTIPILK